MTTQAIKKEACDKIKCVIGFLAWQGTALSGKIHNSDPRAVTGAGIFTPFLKNSVLAGNKKEQVF